MYLEHNGHFLTQLDEAHAYLQHTISDFEQLLALTKKVNAQHLQQLAQLKAEVQHLKEAQLLNLNKAFADLHKRLDAKQEQLG